MQNLHKIFLPDLLQADESRGIVKYGPFQIKYCQVEYRGQQSQASVNTGWETLLNARLGACYWRLNISDMQQLNVFKQNWFDCFTFLEFLHSLEFHAYVDEKCTGDFVYDPYDPMSQEERSQLLQIADFHPLKHGFSAIQAERYFCDALGIDFDFPVISIGNSKRGWLQVQEVTESSPLLEQASIFAFFAPQYESQDASFSIPHLGAPDQLIELKSRSGRVSMCLGEYLTDFGQPQYLPFTLWAKESDLPRQRWFLLRPQQGVVEPYGAEHLHKWEAAKILIVDSLRLFEELTGRIKENNLRHQFIVVCWPNELPACEFKDFSWDALDGREVVLLQEYIADELLAGRRFKVLADQVKLLQSSGVRAIELMFHEVLPSDPIFRVDDCGFRNKFWSLSALQAEFPGLSKALDGFQKLPGWRFEDNHDNLFDESYFLDGVLPKGKLVALCSDLGRGSRLYLFFGRL